MCVSVFASGGCTTDSFPVKPQQRLAAFLLVLLTAGESGFNKSHTTSIGHFVNLQTVFFNLSKQRQIVWMSNSSQRK